MAEKPADECPLWIDELTEDIGQCIATGVVPIAYDVWGPSKRVPPGEPEDPDDAWLIHFYPPLIEVIGGSKDGAIMYDSGMSVDLLSLLEIFADPGELEWITRARNREPRYDGAVVKVSGWYQGHPVVLRVFDVPPDDACVDALYYHRNKRLVTKEQPQG